MQVEDDDFVLPGDEPGRRTVQPPLRADLAVTAIAARELSVLTIRKRRLSTVVSLVTTLRAGAAASWKLVRGRMIVHARFGPDVSSYEQTVATVHAHPGRSGGRHTGRGPLPAHRCAPAVHGRHVAHDRKWSDVYLCQRLTGSRIDTTIPVVIGLATVIALHRCNALRGQDAYPNPRGAGLVGSPLVTNSAGPALWPRAARSLSPSLPRLSRARPRIRIT